MRATIPVLAAAALAGAGCGSKRGSGDGVTGTLSSEVRATAVDQAPLDPADRAWAKTPETKVALNPQQVTYPMASKLAVAELRVRALADGDWVSIRLAWNDDSKSDELDVDQFSDAVAIELPLGNPVATNPMMGDERNPVFLVHWKAVWQRDQDVGRWDIQDRHPGFWVDTYPHATGGMPYPVETAFESANARRYLPAVSADNPVAKITRLQPVEELHAHGFGSLASQQFQDARGRGAWKDGEWQVVLQVPRTVQDPANPTLAAGDHQLAFAVWEGKEANVGGRKQWFPFVKLVVP